MRYFVFVQDIWNEENAILSNHPPEVEEAGYRFRDGVSLVDWFPRHAEYSMSQRYQKARGLYDLQSNTLQVLVVSKALRTILEETGCQNIEFLPITIRNHRGKIASAEHSIANVLGLTECVNRALSTWTADALIPTRVSRFEKLVLEEAAIPPELHIFRLKERPWTHLVTETLKKAIEGRGLRGMSFIPPEEYDSALHR